MLIDSDEILAVKAIAGDSKSLENLVTRYQKKIFSFIYRMVFSVEDARDLTQEVFVQVFLSLNQFRGEAKFSTWLYRIASNKSLDFLRRNQKIEKTIAASKIDTLALMGSSLNHHNPEQVFIQEEKIRRLRRLIAGLPDKYRLTLILFHYENLTYQQIAEALDLPVKTVATRLYRSKLILKEQLGGEIDGVS